MVADVNGVVAAMDGRLLRGVKYPTEEDEELPNDPGKE